MAVDSRLAESSIDFTVYIVKLVVIKDYESAFDALTLIQIP